MDLQEVGISKGSRRKESKPKCWGKNEKIRNRSFFPGGERKDGDRMGQTLTSLREDTKRIHYNR